MHIVLKFISMELNWPVIVGFLIVALLLIALLIYRNFKDEQEFENKINFRDEHQLHHPENEDENRR